MSQQKQPPQNNIMLSGPIASSLTKLATPMVLALVVIMSFDAVDTFFVSQLGVEQLAAISFTVPVATLFLSVAIGLSAGVTIVVSRAVGAQDEDAARRITSDGMLMASVLSLLLAILGWSINDTVFTWLGAEGQTMEYIRDYMNIWYFGVPGILVPMVCFSALRARGLNKLQSYILVCSALVNIVLDPLLIFGIGGFPRLEMTGAALATVIGRWCSLLIACYIMAFRLRLLGRFWVSSSSFLQSMKKIFHVGVPATATNLVVPIAGNITMAIVAAFGATAVAGFGVALRIETIALTVFLALSSVVGPFFGQNIGAGLYQRLHDTLTILVKFVVCWGLFLAALLYFLGESIAGLFTESEAALAVAVTYLATVPVSYMGYGLVMSLNAMFNGSGMPVKGLVLSVGRVALLLMPLIWLLKQFWGVDGIFVAIALSNMAMGIIGYFWLRNSIQMLQASNK